MEEVGERFVKAFEEYRIGQRTRRKTVEAAVPLVNAAVGVVIRKYPFSYKYRDDMLGDCYLAIYEILDTMNGVKVKEPAAFMMSALINKCKDTLRKHRTISRYESTSEYAEKSVPPDTLMQLEVDDFMAALPGEFRKNVQRRMDGENLSFVNGHDYVRFNRSALMYRSVLCGY